MQAGLGTTSKISRRRSFTRLILTVMRRALRRHHDWLAKREITAVISPDRMTDGCMFVFYFDNKREATRFKREFVDQPARVRKKDEEEPE